MNNDLNTNQEGEFVIQDHSAFPFKQYTRLFQKENLTEITVEAHNDFQQNTFYILPDFQLRVAVVGNHTCKFSDMHAYDFKDFPHSKFVKLKKY